MPRLLVVDDELNVLYSIEKSLHSEEVQVIVAPTGRQGLVKVEQLRPDAVILDVRLSDICQGTRSITRLGDTNRYEVNRSLRTIRRRVVPFANLPDRDNPPSFTVAGLLRLRAGRGGAGSGAPLC